MMLWISAYLFISKVTKTKVKFCFYKQCSQEATCLICKRVIFIKCYCSILALIFLYTLKKIPWKNCVRFYKGNLKCTHQSAQESFSRKPNLKFYIQHDFICQCLGLSKDQASMFKYFVIIDFFDRRLWNIFKNTFWWLHKRQQIFLFS